MITLRRYIGKDVLLASLAVFAGLLMLFAFFDLIHELSSVGQRGYTITTALVFVAWQLPSRLYELVPVAALSGTLFAMAQLVRNSEYTVMRASGMSLVQTAWAVLRVGIPLALATFLAGEYIAPPAARLAQTIRATALGDATRVFAQQFGSGFWFKETSTFINVRTVLPDTTLLGVRIYEFDSGLRLVSVRVADSASFMEDGQWKLTNVHTTEFHEDTVTASAAPALVMRTLLRPSLLTVYQVAPDKLELGALWDNIRVLGSNAQKTSRFEIAFWNKVFYPTAVLAMMVLALPFAHFQRRQSNVGFRVFVGTMIGLSFYLIGRLFSYLGVLNDWPAVFVAVFPLATFMLLALGMLWWIEKR